MSALCFVCGVHRSGTSTTAAMLAFCGYSIGKASIRPNREDNAHGYYENFDVVQFNERLMNSMGLRWDTLAVDPELYRPHQAERYDRAVALLKENYGDVANGLLKDPRLAVSLSFWRTVARQAASSLNIRHVFVNRHPRGVVQSLVRRSKKEVVPFQYADQPEKAYLFWIFNTLSYLEQLQGHDVLVSDYNDQHTVESRAALFARFAEFLDFKLDDRQIEEFERKFYDAESRRGMDERRSDEDLSIEERDAIALYEAIKRGDAMQDILAAERFQAYHRMSRLLSEVIGQEALRDLKQYGKIRPDYEKGLAIIRSAEMIFGRASAEDLARILAERRRFGG